MKKLNISEDLDFNLEDVIGKCIGILGIRGSGKSNTAGVIFEELLNYNYPLTVVDIDGEYFGLKEEYELLVIGEGENVDLNIQPEDAAQVAEVSIKQSIPVVLDLSGYLQEDQRTMLKGYFTRLWNLAGKLRKPYMIGIEESHEFIPQGKKGELKEIITRIALRGRKRGLGGVIISQRSAKVEKDVLTQAGMLFLHRVVHEADMKVYNDLLPWPKSEVREKIGLLDTGDCIFLNEKSASKIYVRERNTFHAGFTPSLDTVETPQLKQVGENILEAIEEAKKKGRKKKSKVEKLEERVKELESELEEKTQRVQELEETARTLGYIQIDMDQPDTPKVQKVSKAIIESLEIADVIKDGEIENAIKAIAGTLRSGALASGEGGGDQEMQKQDDADKTYSENEETPRIDRVTRPQNASDIGKSAGAKNRDRKSSTVEEVGSSSGEEIEKYNQLPKPVKKSVRKVIRKVERTDPIKQKIGSFLVSHRPHAYSIEKISAWMDIPTNLILMNRPHELIQMGLIKIEGKSTGVHYRCNLKNFVEDKFSVYEPDISSREFHWIILKIERELAGLLDQDGGNSSKKSDYINISKVGSRSSSTDLQFRSSRKDYLVGSQLQD